MFNGNVVKDHEIYGIYCDCHNGQRYTTRFIPYEISVRNFCSSKDCIQDFVFFHMFRLLMVFRICKKFQLSFGLFKLQNRSLY